MTGRATPVVGPARAEAAPAAGVGAPATLLQDLAALADAVERTRAALAAVQRANPTDEQAFSAALALALAEVDALRDEVTRRAVATSSQVRGWYGVPAGAAQAERAP